MNLVFAIVIFVTQGLVLGWDEFVFHRRRGLPRWERLGHPFDTLSALICFGIALALPIQGLWIRVYAVAALCSCVFVTKDEWVHAAHCTPGEHWLHALLFLLHPALLFAAYTLWRNGQVTAHRVLALEAVAAAVFAGYQWMYWNTPWLRNVRR